MDYGERYKAELVTAIHNIDLVRINQVIECLKEARSYSRRIFTCGSGGAGASGSQFLADTIRQGNFKQGPRLRILCLNAQIPTPPDTASEQTRDRLFIEQLKGFAEPGDVVIGISGSGNAASILGAFEYASWIGCRTIAVTGSAGKIANVANINVTVPASHAGSTDDALMAICHMIGYYFLDSDEQ